MRKRESSIEQNSEIKKISVAAKNETHFSYKFKIIFFTLIFLLLISSGIYFLTNSVSLNSKKYVYYNEKSNLDYTVCLKKNSFYETECQAKNMKYVASLINKIKLNFNYEFNIDEKEDIDFTYDIVGKLVISDLNSDKSFFEKEYKLVTDKSSKLSNGKSSSIAENLELDYSYYNNLANNFRTMYGVDANSNLIVYMTIKKNSKDTKIKLDDNIVMMVKIPLSEKSIDIELDYKEFNYSSNLVKNTEVSVDKVIYICLAIVLISLGIITMVKIIRIVIKANKVNRYDRYIKKILKEYDRLIGEASSMINLDGKEIVEFKKFGELLDIHDNLGLPIMHYVVTEHVKSYFYIVHENIVYMHIVKASDFESN